MRLSLRASTQGLEVVDRARRSKGWSRQAPAWYQTALTSQATLKRFLQGEPIQQETFIKICQAVGLERWQEIVDSTMPVPSFTPPKPIKDWNGVPDVSVFYGRTEELAMLEQWVVRDRCRLVALLGMGGIGKTALAVKLAEQIQNQFEYVVWRSLRHAPSVEEVLADLLQFLSNQMETDLPNTVDARVSLLIKHLREHRCLLVLDNLETIMCSGDFAGHYRAGYKSYGEFLKRVGDEPHQSVVVLTSRESPREITFLEGETLPVRSRKLDGLGEAAREILKEKGLSGSENWGRLIKYYRGNPFVLKLVSAAIKEVFYGNVSEFLKQSLTLITGDISNLIEQQFNRLSALEKMIMCQLAIEQEPVALEKLQANLSFVSKQKLLEALVSLGWRSLIEKTAAGFTLQPAVMEYVTNRMGPDGEEYTV